MYTRQCATIIIPNPLLPPFSHLLPCVTSEESGEKIKRGGKRTLGRDVLVLHFILCLRIQSRGFRAERSASQLLISGARRAQDVSQESGQIKEEIKVKYETQGGDKGLKEMNESSLSIKGRGGLNSFK